MPHEPNPHDDPDLFDAIELGGSRSPGQVKSITGHERKINWDVKEGSGQSGASSTLKSVPLRTVTVTFFLADADDIAASEIRSFVLASMGGVAHDGKGGQTIAVQFQEYAPPKPKGGSATGSSSKKPNAANDPNAAANAELAALTKQYQATPWG